MYVIFVIAPVTFQGFVQREELKFNILRTVPTETLGAPLHPPHARPGVLETFSAHATVVALELSLYILGNIVVENLWIVFGHIFGLRLLYSCYGCVLTTRRALRIPFLPNPEVLHTCSCERKVGFLQPRLQGLLSHSAVCCGAVDLRNPLN